MTEYDVDFSEESFIDSEKTYVYCELEKKGLGE